MSLSKVLRPVVRTLERAVKKLTPGHGRHRPAETARSPASKKARRVARRVSRLPNVAPSVYRHVGVKPGEELPAFAWPGGYPIVYYLGDGDAICSKCVNDYHSYKQVKYGDVYWEGPPEECAECGAEIESAYGDPNDSEDAED